MEKICKNCFYLDKDGLDDESVMSFHFCCHKDLYTEVDVGQECDEKDFWGNLMFSPKNTDKQN